MQTSEVLNAAADHIQVYGHRKHGLGGVGHPTCALGAISAVMGGNGVEWMAPGQAFYRYLGDSIAGWNNAPERTAVEVIEALRACAVIEQSRERQPVEVA